MADSKKITLLLENNPEDWDSVRELRPALVEQWRNYCEAHEIQFQALYAENERALSLVNKASDSDWVVVASHCERIFSALKILRKFSENRPRFAIYLYGLSTVACWPLQLDGTMKLLNNSDLFLGTCDGDAKCMDLNFVNARVAVTSFPLSPISVNRQEANNIHRFAFVGRISRQKNIGAILEALALLKDEHPNLDWRFDIFGKEDNLGIPVLGIPDKNYLQELKLKTQDLDLESQVHFRGWKPAEEIWQELHPKNTTLVSASLHSEENFGLAVYRGLSLGFRAALSQWGGHQNLAYQFSKKVSLVPVHLGYSGPRIFPRQLKESLLATLQFPNEEIQIPSNSLSDLTQWLEEGDASLPINPTNFGRKIAEQRLQFANKNNQQIFIGPEDPAFRRISEAYGAVLSPEAF